MVDDVHALNAQHHDFGVAEVLSHHRQLQGARRRRASSTSATSKRARRTGSGPGYLNSFYDPYSEEARDIYWRQINENAQQLGIDAWWLDADRARPAFQPRHRRAQGAHRAHRDGPGARVLQLLSAGAHAGRVRRRPRGAIPTSACSSSRARASPALQRNAAAVWSGDVVSRWDDLRDQISAGVNFSMSGLPNWTFDIGGFALEKRYENQNPARPAGMARAQHCAGSSSARSCRCSARTAQFPYREIYNIAPEGTPRSTTAWSTTTSCATACCRTSTRSPRDTYHRDGTIMRGLVMDFPERRRRSRDIDDQYLFGPAFLVAPVYAVQGAQRARSICRRAATWYDFYTGERYDGRPERSRPPRRWRACRCSCAPARSCRPGR